MQVQRYYLDDVINHLLGLTASLRDKAEEMDLKLQIQHLELIERELKLLSRNVALVSQDTIKERLRFLFLELNWLESEIHHASEEISLPERKGYEAIID